jgi:hypothetical protein
LDKGFYAVRWTHPVIAALYHPLFGFAGKRVEGTRIFGARISGQKSLFLNPKILAPFS